MGQVAEGGHGEQALSPHPASAPGRGRPPGRAPPRMKGRSGRGAPPYTPLFAATAAKGRAYLLARSVPFKSGQEAVSTLAGSNAQNIARGAFGTHWL